MIKLNAGFGRKVGEPNYGSRGASVNVELELESSLISDPDALMARIRELFDIARQSVDTELANGSPNVENGAAIRRAWEAIAGGHFYPSPSSMGCAGCPYWTACQNWEG